MNKKIAYLYKNGNETIYSGSKWSCTDGYEEVKIHVDLKPLTDDAIQTTIDKINFKSMVTPEDIFYLIARSIESAHGIE